MKKKTRKIVIGSAVFAFLATSIIGLSQFLLKGLELENNQNTFLEELEENKGTYDEKSIVLQNTSYGRANELKEKLNAKLRITNNGKYATLTLPSDTTIIDVVKDDDNKSLLKEISIDYQASISEFQESEEEFLPSKPNYTVNDEYYTKQSYLDYINIGDAWNNVSSKGSNITIAVIDTGIDTDHIEFQGRISEYSYNATYKHFL